MRINNKFYARGRYVRDPVVADAKDGSGKKYVFGRVAAEQGYIDQNGDTRTSTKYIEVRVFCQDQARALIEGKPKMGTLIEVCGFADCEADSYEKDGEVKHTAKLLLNVESGYGGEHYVRIEAQPKERASE